ncbi:MAG: type I restriction endonuclease [Bacillota bacterium]
MLILTPLTHFAGRGNLVFHVTAEFRVDRSRSTEVARPDIVLFVNGIPLAVIECKSVPGRNRWWFSSEYAIWLFALYI